jgi:negative regulator of flagellin synthesis FlgM
MKIGQFEPKHTPSTTSATERRTGSAPANGASEPSAKVELSSAATAPTEESSFDQAKVDRIATAIREGRFTIDADAIADKLIGNARELLGRSTN